MPQPKQQNHAVIATTDGDAADKLDTFLQQSGRRVTAVGLGSAVIEVAARERVDIVIADVRLPDMDGQTLIRQLAERRLTCPVVVVSSNGDTDDVIDAVSAGAADVLRKPWTEAALELVIDRATIRSSTWH